MSTGLTLLNAKAKELFLRVVENNEGMARARRMIKEVVRVFLLERKSRLIAKISMMNPNTPIVPSKKI